MVDDCYFLVKGGVENTYGKVNILLQTFISRGYVDSFSLVSDLGYVAQVESSLQIAILYTFFGYYFQINRGHFMPKRGYARVQVRISLVCRHHL